MGLFSNELRREFIARPDDSKGQIVYKWPDTTIRKFTQLTVEPDEVALFLRDGHVVGVVEPGRVTLDNAMLPFLGALIDMATGGNLFKARVFPIEGMSEKPSSRSTTKMACKSCSPRNAAWSKA